MSTKAHLKSLMEKHGLHAQRSLGQCFLIDDNVLRKIALYGLAGKEDTVIEIGPGLGPLSEALLEGRKERVGGQQYAIEIDKGLVEVLRAEYAERIEIIHHDATKFDFSTLGVGPFALVGNLPYNVTTPLLLNFLKYKQCFGQTTVMIQKEVADRLLATPKQKAYGSLTVLFQLHSEMERIMDVSPECFWPQPKVWSTVIQIDWRSQLAVPCKDPAFLEKVVRASFAQRRKTLRNSLQSQFSKENVIQLSEQSEIDLKRRAETLTLQEFVILAEQLQVFVS